MSEWVWLVKFLFGVSLGYYVMSPRWRGFVNGLVMLLVITIFPKLGRHYQTRFEKQRVEPVQEVMSTAKVVKRQDGGPALNVSQEELDMWLKRNPDLRLPQ